MLTTGGQPRLIAEAKQAGAKGWIVEALQARHAARDGAQAGRASAVSVLPAQQLLLVDPAGHGTSVLASRMRMQGYAVTEVSDPAEAVLRLVEPPAAVVADLWMTGISGVQLCRLLLRPSRVRKMFR